MPIYLQDISAHVPLFFVLIASLMVLSMPNKWHYLLLVPLGLCLWGVYMLSRPFNIYYSQTTKTYIKDLILTVVMIVMLVSAAIHADTHNQFQASIRSVVMILMAFLSFLICFSSPIQNVYMRILGFLFVFCLFIFSMTFIINDDPVLRKGLYWCGITIMLFFMFYYWKSLMMSSWQQKKKRKQPATAWQFRQLPKNDGVRSRLIA
jgi:hypothetical protein